MSIILDALKRADAERHVGELPDLRSVPVVPNAMPVHHRRWQWLLPVLGIVALISAGIVWHVVVDQTTRVGPAASTNGSNAAASVRDDTTPATANAPFVASPIVASEVSAPPPLPVAPKPARVIRSAVPAEAGPQMHEQSAPTAVSTAGPTSAPVQTQAQPPSLGRGKAQAPTPAQAQVPTQAQAQAPTPAQAQVPTQAQAQAQTQAQAQAQARTEQPGPITLAQLPAQIRAELPALAIGGSMYSGNPADRMLLVDKRMLHEGDEIAPGLLLEAIQPKSAILRYKGFVFRLPL